MSGSSVGVSDGARSGSGLLPAEDVPWGVSPDGFFWGVVGLCGSDFSSLQYYLGDGVEYGLLYWNTADDSVTAVKLGRGSEEEYSVHGVCWGSMYADRDALAVYYRVDYGFRDIYYSVLVPWGGEAYPQFVLPESYRAAGGGSVPAVFDDAVLDMSYYDYEWMRVSTRDGVRYFPVFDSDVLPEMYIPPEEPPMYQEGQSPVVMSGGDGVNYAVMFVGGHPACTASLTYVISAADPEVKACGWSQMGPILMNPGNTPTAVSEPELPASHLSELWSENSHCKDYIQPVEFWDTLDWDTLHWAASRNESP